MKKIGLTLKTLLIIAIFPLLTSCNRDEESSSRNTFDYEFTDLVGIWTTSEIKDDATNTWYSVDSSTAYNLFSFSIRFYSDYTYLYNGTTTDESGSYTTYGSLITTYVNSTKQAEYDVKSLKDGEMEITLVRGTDATDYRLIKRW